MNASDNFITFGSPAIGDSEISMVSEVLRSGWLGTGPKVKCFEDNFKLYKGAHSAIAVNSCTAALHLSLISSGISSGDEVITTALTFCATVNSIIHAGGRPVLVDIDEITLNIDENKIEEAITPRTKAIVPVHFAGRPCNMKKIAEIADKYGLKVIEDCAHGIEGSYHNLPLGTIGDFGCFSFYSTKNITTGEGGMLICKDVDQEDQVRRLALHGMSKDAWKRFSPEGYQHYDVVDAGYKYNMMDIQAAIGLVQLVQIEDFRKKRESIWSRYMKDFEGLPIVLPAPPELDTKHAYHLFTLQIEKKNTGLTRDEFILAMHKKKIGVGVHYRAIPEFTYYKDKFGWSLEDFSSAKKIGQSTVSIPLSQKLTDNEVSRIIYSVREILG